VISKDRSSWRSVSFRAATALGIEVFVCADEVSGVGGLELPINFLTLHRCSIRHEYFSTNESRDPFFDAATKTWLITNPSHCKELLASANLRPASFAENYHTLQQRLGIDFSSLTFTFDHIPLCLYGDRHMRARRRASEFLVARKAALNARIPQAVATHFDALQREGRVEIMDSTVVPLILDIMSTVIDTDISVVDCRNASLVFDQSIGVNKRRKIAAEIATLRDLISSRLGASATEDEVGLRLALVILGKDTLIGTLGESLYRLLELNPGRRLCEIDYPEFPLETGVPIIERVVVTPFKLATCNFVSGDRVRILMQTFAYTAEPRNRANFFGTGAHACLGRPVSMQLWNAITAFLSKVPLLAHVLAYYPRTSDYIFACPERLEVDLCR
jgi:hypothetical protein